MSLGASFAWAGWRDPGRAATAATGLWVFMGVAGTLFALFLAAYVMRMAEADASRIALPPLLWLSTALLLLGSVLLASAGVSARRGAWPRALRLHAAGGACALAFLAVQIAAWQGLLDAQVRLAGNPGASFFYLLTAMHGLHVLGGLVAWARTAWTCGRPGRDPVRCAAHVALVARYWHFLFALWLVLFAAMAWLTPELARAICGRA